VLNSQAAACSQGWRLAARTGGEAASSPDQMRVAGADPHGRPYRRDPAAEKLGTSPALTLAPGRGQIDPQMRGGLFEGSGLTQGPLHLVALEIGKRLLAAVQTEPGPADFPPIGANGAAASPRGLAASAVTRPYHRPSLRPARECALHGTSERLVATREQSAGSARSVSSYHSAISSERPRRLSVFRDPSIGRPSLV
jgi:hypothetical protein